MARYYREPARRSPLENAAYLFVIAFILGTLFLVWPMFQTRLAGAPGREQPTSRTYATQPALGNTADQQDSDTQAVPTTVQQAIDHFNATAEAGAIQQAAPQPNVDTTNDSAPVVRESKPSALQPAGDNVSVAEPIPTPDVNDQFGSKPVIVNPQADHQCLHGQIWIDTGCHRPTPVQ